MIGIIICTHSNLAQGLKDAATMVCGEQEDFDAIGFYEGQDIMDLSEKLKSIAGDYEKKNEKYVFLVDMFGATPYNASAIALSESEASIITGVSLPIVIELLIQRQQAENLDALFENVKNAAADAIKVIKVKEFLNHSN